MFLGSLISVLGCIWCVFRSSPFSSSSPLTGQLTFSSHVRFHPQVCRYRQLASSLRRSLLPRHRCVGLASSLLRFLPFRRFPWSPPPSSLLSSQHSQLTFSSLQVSELTLPPSLFSLPNALLLLFAVLSSCSGRFGCVFFLLLSVPSSTALTRSLPADCVWYHARHRFVTRFLPRPGRSWYQRAQLASHARFRPPSRPLRHGHVLHRPRVASVRTLTPVPLLPSFSSLLPSTFPQLTPSSVL
jgi:hypothetical protein